MFTCSVVEELTATSMCAGSSFGCCCCMWVSEVFYSGWFQFTGCYLSTLFWL